MAKILNPTESKILRNFLIAKKVADTIPKMLNLLDRINYPDTDPDLEQFGKTESVFVDSLLRILNKEPYLDLVLNLCAYLIEEYENTEDIGKVAARLKKPQGQIEDKDESDKSFDWADWTRIDEAFLDAEIYESDEDRHDGISAFFKGALPTWKHVQSGDVYERGIVQDIIKRINTRINKSIPYVLNLIDAGGEGKSTILRQVVSNLIRNETTKINIVWFEFDKPNAADINIKALLEAIKKLDDNTPYLIVCDEASQIGHQIFEVVQTLYRTSEKIHFLLSTTERAWNAKGLKNKNWGGYTQDYHSIPVGKLSLNDAIGIIQKWADYDKDFLGTLYEEFAQEIDNKNYKNAARELINKTSRGAGFQDGSFLGAMLQIRLNNTEKLEQYITEIFSALQSQEIDGVGINLLEVFIHIAAMHSLGEKFEILDKKILVEALRDDNFNPSPFELGRFIGKVQEGLGREAAIAISDDKILTRHWRIAKHATDMLKKPPWHMSDYIMQCYAKLAVAARDSFHDNKEQMLPTIDTWTHALPDYFARNQLKWAIHIAEAMWKNEKYDSHRFADWTRYIERRNKNEAIGLFYKHAKEYPQDRWFHAEWGKVEAIIADAEYNSKRRYQTIWLTGYSLSDQCFKLDPESDASDGFTYNSSDDYKKYGYIRGVFANFLLSFKLFPDSRIFLDAYIASAKLARCFPLTKDVPGLVKDALKAADFYNIQHEKWSLNRTLGFLSDGIREAWMLRERNIEGIITGDRLTFDEFGKRPELLKLK